MVNKITKTRDSNIELLRVLAAVGVLVLHYNNPLAGNAFALAGNGINLILLKFLESFFICAVNLFVLISGYYMSKTRRIKMDKLLRLLLQVMLFNELFFFIDVFSGKTVFSVSGAFFNLLPRNWFMILYISLCILSPFINILIDHLNDGGKKALVIILFLLFSVYPTAVDYLGYFCGVSGLSSISSAGSGDGYTIVNFILMYCIGAVLRHSETKRLTTGKRIVLLLVNTGIIFALSQGPMWTAWEYCSPFVVIQAVLLFTIFREIKMRPSKTINKLAEAAFTVYLIHSFFLKYARINLVANSGFMILHLVGTCFVIYCLGWIIYFLYHNSVDLVVRKVLERFAKRNVDLGDLEQ